MESWDWQSPIHVVLVNYYDLSKKFYFMFPAAVIINSLYMAKVLKISFETL